MGSEEIGNPNSPKGYARKNITLHRLLGNHKRGIAVRRVIQEQEKTYGYHLYIDFCKNV